MRTSSPIGSGAGQGSPLSPDLFLFAHFASSGGLACHHTSGGITLDCRMNLAPVQGEHAHGDGARWPVRTKVLGQSAAVRTARSGSLRAGRRSCKWPRSAGGYLEGQHSTPPALNLSVRGTIMTRHFNQRAIERAAVILRVAECFRRRIPRRAQGGAPRNRMLPQRSQRRGHRWPRSDRGDRRRLIYCAQ